MVKYHNQNILYFVCHLGLCKLGSDPVFRVCEYGSFIYIFHSYTGEDMF
jgi:hypothetical protein